MTKRDWISVFQSDSKERQRNTEQICWESSSSEDDCIGFDKRRKKKHSQVNPRISPVLILQRNASFRTNYNTFESTRLSESPVIELKCSQTYTESPELSQRNSMIFVKEPSPVLEKRRVRLKKNSKLKEIYGIQCVSPDLFEESTQNITCESPVKSQSSQAIMKIEPFPSQFGSPVKPTQNPVKDIPCYYEPPKRRKQYKKGGLAHVVDKVLKLKNSRVQIWHHEKMNNIELQFDEQSSVIMFRLNKVWTEYGNTLLLCEVVSTTLSSNDTSEEERNDMGSLQTEFNHDKQFLINAGFDSMLNIEWKPNTIYQLFPPYNTNKVNYNGQDIVYYNNAAKFMKVKNI